VIKDRKQSGINQYPEDLLKTPLIKHLEKILDQEISLLNIPTGITKSYEFDDALNLVSSHYQAKRAG